MKKTILLLSLVIIAIGCAEDQFENITPTSIDEEATTRAISDIFNVQYIYQNEYEYKWPDGSGGVDNNGDFYYFSENMIYDDYCSVIKPDFESNSIGVFAPYSYWSSYSFCFDENNNLCYLGYSDIVTLNRIKSDGNSWFEQSLSNTLGDFSDICGSPDGYIYVHTSTYSPDHNGYISTLYEVSPRGVMSEVDIDLSGVPYGWDTEVHKADGDYFYLTTTGQSVCHRINITTKTVEEIDLGFRLSYRGAACAGESLYALDGQYIVKITPGERHVDLGTIPSNIKNENGQFVRFGCSELYVNQDASAFYSFGTINNTDGVVVKLTL